MTSLFYADAAEDDEPISAVEDEPISVVEGGAEDETTSETVEMASSGIDGVTVSGLGDASIIGSI